MNDKTDLTTPPAEAPTPVARPLEEFIRGKLAAPALMKQMSLRGRDRFPDDELEAAEKLVAEFDPCLRRLARLATAAWTSRSSGGAACRDWTTWFVEKRLGSDIASGAAGVHGIFSRHRDELKAPDKKTADRAFNSLRLSLLSAHWQTPLDAQDLVAAFRSVLLPTIPERRPRDVDRAASAWILKAASAKSVKDLLASVALWIDAAAAARRSMREVLDERDRALEDAAKHRAANTQLRADMDGVRTELAAAQDTIVSLQDRVRTLENDLVLQRDQLLARVQKQMQGIDTRLRDAEEACALDPPRVNIALQRLQTARTMTRGDEWLSSD